MCLKTLYIPSSYLIKIEKRESKCLSFNSDIKWFFPFRKIKKSPIDWSYLKFNFLDFHIHFQYYLFLIQKYLQSQFSNTKRNLNHFGMDLINLTIINSTSNIFFVSRIKHNLSSYLNFPKEMKILSLFEINSSIIWIFTNYELSKIFLIPI